MHLQSTISLVYIKKEGADAPSFFMVFYRNRTIFDFITNKLLFFNQ
jgi:hypothetical protein